MMLKFVIFSLFFLLAGLSNGVASEISSNSPYTDELLQKISSHPVADIDEFLQSLPAEWRSNYLLIYQSQSLQSASLDRPRVVLYSSNHQFFMSFAGQEGVHPDDQSIEIMEAYGLEAPRFTQISWATRKPVVTRDPAKCATCHKGAGIFESYPNWPGFFGSSHDGKFYGESSGTSAIARFEFEEQALSGFIQNAPSLPRYRNLLNLDGATVSSQALQNENASLVVTTQLQERQNKQIYESLHSLSELLRAITALRYSQSTAALLAASS